MKCVICKTGTTHKGKTTVFLERDRQIVLLRDVPAQICGNCGHYYLSADVNRQVLQRGEESLETGAELLILPLAA